MLLRYILLLLLTIFGMLPSIGFSMIGTPTVGAEAFRENDLTSINRYAYGSNNPYKYVDPTGMESTGETLEIWGNEHYQQGNTIRFHLYGIAYALWEAAGPESLSKVSDHHLLDGNRSDVDGLTYAGATLEAVSAPVLKIVGKVVKRVKDVGAVKSTGYHATLPEVAPLIRQNGFRQGTAKGRLGSGGTYVNNTRQGAIAEFKYHNPGVTPLVLKVQYKPGINASAKVAPKNYVEKLPFNNVDSISAPLVRLPGTTNTNVLNNSVKIVD